MPGRDIFGAPENEPEEGSSVMSDMWNLGQYVEDHPDAYEQRWRLAKKLYLACEYRLALEHLQVLKNEWVRKLNVVRYLAATYYRIGRYDESISELEEAISIWPDEIGLREQLARVLETAGQPAQASAVWAQIHRLDPGHPIAGKAAERLVSPHEHSPEEDLRIQESDSGIDLAPKRVCPSCGAQNSVEFDRCWQCRAPLLGTFSASAMAPDEGGVTPLPGVEAEQNTLRRAYNILAALLLLAVLCYGVFRGISAFPGAQEVPGLVVEPTVYATLLGPLFNLRLVVGLVALLAWPVVFFIALGAVPSDQPNPGVVVLGGFVLAACAAGLAWAPFQTIPELLVLLGIASFLVVFAFFGLTVRDTIIVWLAQCFALPLALAVAMGAVESPKALMEAPAIVQFVAQHDGKPSPDYRFEAPPAVLNANYRIEWQSTGSSWLDGRLATAQFELTQNAKGNPLSFDLKDAGSTVLFEKVSMSPFRTPFELTPGRPYVLSVRGDPEQFGTPLSLVIYSNLKPAIDMDTPQAPAVR